MSTHSPGRDHGELVQYLVGALPEDETERLDELSIGDDRFAADLHAAEHDLVDAYVRGTLTGDTLRRFESHYLSSAAGRAKVAVARGLRNHPGARRLAARPLMPWALAAAATLFLAAAGYLFVENGRLKRQLLDARAGFEGRQQQLEEQLRQSVGQRQVPAPVLATFVLAPPTRGIGEIPALSIPRGSGVVSLQVDLESDDFPAYRAAVRDPATGQTLWQSDVLRSAARGGAKALSITIDAGLLRSRTYTLEVAGVRQQDRAEPVGNYPFRVVLQ